MPRHQLLAELLSSALRVERLFGRCGGVAAICASLSGTECLEQPGCMSLLDAGPVDACQQLCLTTAECTTGTCVPSSEGITHCE